VGLEPFQLEAGIAEAQELFCPLASKEDIDAAVAEALPEASEGRVYLAVDPRELLGDPSQYLLYGSEFLQAVSRALRANTGVDCTDLLTATGTPTILLSDVPLGMIDDGELEAFGVDLLQWLELKGTPHTQVLDSTVTLSVTLPASHIVGCFHPRRLQDRFLGSEPVHFSRRACPWCVVEDPSSR